MSMRPAIHEDDGAEGARPPAGDRGGVATASLIELALAPRGALLLGEVASRLGDAVPPDDLELLEDLIEDALLVDGLSSTLGVSSWTRTVLVTAEELEFLLAHRDALIAACTNARERWAVERLLFNALAAITEVRPQS
jgi:hypothetical protein